MSGDPGRWNERKVIHPLDHSGEGGESPTTQQGFELAFSSIQIDRMAKTGEPGSLPDARLIRIEFPGMQIKNRWFPFLFDDAVDGEMKQPIRKQS